MTEEKRRARRHAAACVNKPKSELMRIVDALMPHDQRKASALDSIISKLERWQCGL